MTITSALNGSTSYAQTTAQAKRRTVNFNANNNTIDATSKSCADIAATYNGTAQTWSNCNVTCPKITAHSNTPTVI